MGVASGMGGKKLSRIEMYHNSRLNRPESVSLANAVSVLLSVSSIPVGVGRSNGWNCE